MKKKLQNSVRIGHTTNTGNNNTRNMVDLAMESTLNIIQYKKTKNNAHF